MYFQSWFQPSNTDSFEGKQFLVEWAEQKKCTFIENFEVQIIEWPMKTKLICFAPVRYLFKVLIDCINHSILATVHFGRQAASWPGRILINEVLELLDPLLAPDLPCVLQLFGFTLNTSPTSPRSSSLVLRRLTLFNLDANSPCNLWIGRCMGL